jgi:hypothetical protein
MNNRRAVPAQAPEAENEAAARAAHLVYVGDEMPGIRRVRKGKGFSSLRPDGTVLGAARKLRRIPMADPPQATTKSPSFSSCGTFGLTLRPPARIYRMSFRCVRGGVQQPDQ